MENSEVVDIDLQVVKSKNPYNHWLEPESKMLVQLLKDAIKDGFRDAGGKFSKLTIETRVLPTLNKNLGINKTYKEYTNRMKVLKARYNGMADLFRFGSGFGWNPETKKFTASDEVWNAYLKAHTNKTNLRDETFEDYGDLHMIFSTNVATGKNAVGLGDATDGDAEETTYEDGPVHVVEETAYEDTSVHEVFSSLEKRRGEKLPHRKRARTAPLVSTKAYDEVNTVTSDHIFDMIQKRWEKESEEKEVEDKANNVWDAIKEIPDLDEDLRYEAMTLVHSLGMKYGFVNMSIPERKGWILRSLRKP